MRLFRKTVQRTGHPGEEECLCGGPAPVAVLESYQLISFRHSQRCEQVREQRLQGPAQPDVEEVRQISVGDVVVVGWIRRNDG